MGDLYVEQIAELREQEQQIDATIDRLEARRWAIRTQISDLRFAAHASRQTARPHRLTEDQLDEESMRLNADDDVG